MAIIRMEDVENIENIDFPPPMKQNETIQIKQFNEGINNNMENINMENDQVISTRNINKTWETYMNNGWLDGKPYQPGPFNDIKDVWKGKPAFIVGSGPDLKVFIKYIGWGFLNGKNAIGINHVIESYDRFKWFIFLDRRFLKKTTYNLDNFKGRIFAQNNTGISSRFKNVVRYRCQSNSPTKDITKGLYSNRFSGLVALNLAIIAGANPIFLIGFGMGKDGNENDFHFRKKYQGVGTRPKQQFQKYLRVYNHFNKFKKWFPAIIHVTAGKPLVPAMKKMNFQAFKKKFAILVKQININKNLQPKIAHLSFSKDINVHADITRGIINNCFGKHSIHTFKNYPKDADLYITEHFLSTNKAVNNFPYKDKTINIVHSMGCLPQGNFICNVALTNAWQRFLIRNRVRNIRVIHGGIDLKPYENIKPNFESKTFGRITRWSPGKIPYWWNETIKQILNENKDVKCLMFINNIHGGRKLLNYDRMKYNKECKIIDFKGKFLKKLSIYVHANGTFKETMSHAVIEAMACGLPVVYLKEPAVNEVVGNAGIGVNNAFELKNMVIKLLNDNSLQQSYFKLSKNRAKFFDINKTIAAFDKLIKEIVGEC